MKLRNIVIALALLLSACGGMSTVERVTLTCNGYAATLEALTAFEQAGRLSNAQGAKIDRAEVILTTACLGDPENFNDGLVDMVEEAMLEMILIKGDVR